MRADLQLLRAVAVLLVVVYHLWPAALPGGYTGVDVFFVLSGFLITDHLLREVDRTGSVRLGAFWARRARRLLPASLLVLAATAAAVVALAPRAAWPAQLREVVASALYVENWSLAAASVDYLAEGSGAAATQHYWSLSAEEQFYLVWPLLVLAAAVLARRVPALRRRRRAVVAVVLGAVVAGSFAWSLHLTAADPARAYFVTPARAWQFGAGGLLALAGARWAGRGRRAGGAAAGLASWAGLALVATGAVVFDAATPFPGTAALVPVAGALLVVWAGEPRARWSPAPLASLRPVRWLGDVSYSLYLWHWPPVVLLPLALGRDTTTPERVAVLAGCLLLAGLTKRWVEDPVRTWAPLAGQPARAGHPARRAPSWRTWAAAATATAVVVGGALTGSAVVQRQVAAARAQALALAEAGTPCVGAAALAPGAACPDPHALPGGAALQAATAFARADLSAGMACLVDGQSEELRPCRLGDPDAPVTVALVGDSHAAAWYEAVDAVARQDHRGVVLYAKAGCWPSGSDRLIGAHMPLSEPPHCAAWGSALLDRLVADPGITEVLTTARSDIYGWRAPDGTIASPTVPADVAQGVLRRLADAGKRVDVLRAVPATGTREVTATEVVDGSVDVPGCLDAAAAARPADQADAPLVDACSLPRAQALVDDGLADAARAMADPRVGVLDLSDSFCDAERCHQVTGGVVVSFDSSHMSATWSRTMAAPLTRALVAAGDPLAP